MRGARWGIALACAALAGEARGESPDVLPPGSMVLYGGSGLGTFQYGSSGWVRDRQWRGRLDTYAGFGVRARLQLSFDAPFMQTWVQEFEDRGPCPTEDDSCDPVTTVGEVGLHARTPLARGRAIRGALDLGARTDAWNASTRHRWTNAGLGVTSLVASTVWGGGLGPASGWAAWGRYRLTFGREVEGSALRLPGDAAMGGAEAWADVAGLRLQLGASAYSRLWGVPFGETFVEDFYPTEDRWAALRYRELKGEAKLSLPLGQDMGLHVALGRVIVADSGPRDAMELSVGVHRWFPP